MNYVTLGKSSLRVSQFGFGCEQLGGYAWGAVSQSEVVSALHEALDRGVNLFDTADVYATGESERQLGRALRGRRADAVIATKFGVRFDSSRNVFYDNRPQWIGEALEESLKRLDTDYIDLYWMHYPDGATPLTAVCEALERKVAEGKIRYYGLSNLPPADVPTKLPDHCVALQVEYSLAKRAHEAGLLSLVHEGKLTPILFGCLGQGILSGKYDVSPQLTEDDRRRHEKYVNFHGQRLNQNLRIVETMRGISAQRGCSLAQIAMRWILDRIGGSVTLAGIKRPEQLRDFLPAFTWRLDEAELRALDSVSACATTPSANS